MPSNLLAIDSNFPTFTGEEPVEEQIRELVNYLYQLRESLQYSLKNLTTDNFNAAALQNLTDDAKGEIGNQLQKIANELNQLSSEVETLKGRISGIDSLTTRMKNAETDIENMKTRVVNAEGELEALQTWSSYQEKTVGDIQERVDNVEQELADQTTAHANTEQRVAALSDLMAALDADVTELLTLITVADDGSVTMGKEGQDLHLVGNVYINGILFEQGGST